jgi:Tfp pilus assembly protein PilV
MVVVLGFSMATLAMYAYIDKKSSQGQEAERQRRMDNKLLARIQSRQAEATEASVLGNGWHAHTALASDVERVFSYSASSMSGSTSGRDLLGADSRPASDLENSVNVEAVHVSDDSVTEVPPDVSSLSFSPIASSTPTSNGHAATTGSARGSTEITAKVEKAKPTLVDIYRLA